MDFIKAYDAAWVVYNHQISYLKPAMVGEWVRILTRLIWLNENTIILEYYMTDEEKTHLKTLLWSTMRYVSFKTGRSTSHSEKVLDYLNAVLAHDIDDLDCKKRVSSLKESIRHWDKSK